MDGIGPGGDTDSTDAFAVLSNETRLGVLLALGEARETLSFSALYDAVDIDDSGQFNYHLDKLVGRFVHKTDAGYELTSAGKQVYSAVLSGLYGESVDIDPVALDRPCPDCDTGLELTYVDETTTVGCPDCDREFISFPMPPAAVQGRDPATLPAVVDRYQRTAFRQATGGICPLCTGPMDGDLRLDVLPEVDDEEMPVVVFACRRCGTHVRSTPGALVLQHPATVEFYYSMGVDLRAIPAWSLDWLGGNAVSVRSTDPLEVTVTVEYDDETLELAVDADLSVSVVETPA
jgi:hypothetical protein